MKLFVGNLPRETSEEELNELFAEFGAVVSCKIIKDRETGQSRGFGFVEMTSSDEGNKAMTELQGKEVRGRALVVNEAREQKSREPRFNR